MDKVFIDLCDEEKVSVIKRKARDVVINDLLEYLNSKYERARKVGNGDIGVVVGQAKDEDGFAADIVVVVHGTVKPWYSKAAEREGGRATRKFDLDEGTIYSDEDIANGLDGEPNGADAYEEAQAAKEAPKK